MTETCIIQYLKERLKKYYGGMARKEDNILRKRSD